MSPCFRAVCRGAQGKRWFVGEEGRVKLIKEKKKQKLKEEFANELVWLPVVGAVRGDLTTYDQPGDSAVRVTYLDQFGDDRTKHHPGWFMDKAPLTAERYREVAIACDEQYQLDGKVQLAIDRPWLTTRVFPCSCRLRASDRKCDQKTIPEVFRRRSVGVSGRSARGSGGSDRRAIACVECLIRVRASACLFFSVGALWLVACGVPCPRTKWPAKTRASASFF